MKDWALQHPYLTFFMVLFAMGTISSTITTLFGKSVKKEPDKPKDDRKETDSTLN